MTMALPLAFAACTSEEFESYDSNVSLAQRTEIGQVDLTFGFGDAQTRWDAGLNEEVSDVLGAALIDAPKTTPDKNSEKGKWETHYQVQTYISSNYPYTFNGERWTSEAKLVEGSYVFYAPYAADHQVRSAIKYAAPVAQKLEVENGKVVEMSAVADMAENFTNPFYFGYKFFDATDDNRNISVELRHIFAYPKFTLKNTTGENVTITRILVQDENGTIPAEGEFSNSAIATAMNNTKEGWGAPQSGNMKESLETEGLLNTSNTETYKKTNLVRADLSEAVTVANNGEITFSIVMPAMRFGTGDMTVYFVTESGKAYTFTNSTSTINLVPGRRYPAEDYQVSGELKTAAGQLLTKTINKNETLVDAPYIVTSTQELIDAINSTPANLTSPLKLTIAGDVDFDATVLKTIAEEMSQPVQLVGSINIIGGADADNALDINQKVIFGDAVIESGYVKFNRADEYGTNGTTVTNANGLNFKTVTVAEGATLVVEKVSTILGDNIEVSSAGVISADGAGTAVITNNGTLELKAAVENVVNNGALKLSANGSFDKLDTDNEEVQSQTITVSGDTEYTGNLEGAWTIEKGATLTLTGNNQELPYGSSLKVDGTLKGAALTVKGEMTLNGRTDADITLQGKYVAVPTATNKTENAVLNLNSGSVVVGDVEGAASDKEAQIVNIADNSIGFLGTITNTSLKATYTFTGNVTKSDDIAIPANVNTLVIDGNVAAAANAALAVGSNEIKDLTITGNIQALNEAVTVTMNSTAAVVKVQGDILASNNVTIGGTELEVAGLINAKGVAITATTVKKATLGDVTLEGAGAALTLAAQAEIVLNGELVSNQAVDWTTAKSLVLKGNVTMANVSLKVPAAVNVFGNVTIDGTGANAKVENGTAPYTITVGANSKLTIGSGMTVTGASGATVTFASSTNGEDGQAVAGAKTGEVMNNGKVSFANVAYEKNDTYPWWDGNKATTN